MRRHSFLFFLPPLLLVLVLLLWARSYLPDHTEFRSHQGRVLIFFATGDFVPWFDSSSARYSGTPFVIDYCRRVAQAQSMPNHHFLGFEWTALNFKSGYPGFIAIPYWAIATVLAGLSIFAILRRRAKRERSLPGHCRACGYDLRGSNGKCPECGEDVASGPRTTSTAAAE